MSIITYLLFQFNVLMTSVIIFKHRLSKHYFSRHYFFAILLPHFSKIFVVSVYGLLILTSALQTKSNSSFFFLAILLLYNLFVVAVHSLRILTDALQSENCSSFQERNSFRAHCLILIFYFILPPSPYANLENME